MENLTPKSEFPPWPSPPQRVSGCLDLQVLAKKPLIEIFPSMPLAMSHNSHSARHGLANEEEQHKTNWDIQSPKRKKNTSLLRRAGITFLQILCCCPICDCALTFTIFFLVLMPILRLFKMGWSFGGYKMQHNRTQKAQKNRFCVCGLLYVSLHLQKNQGL